MNSTARLGLIIGVAVLLAAMLAVLIWDRSEPPPDKIDDEDEAAYWDEQAKRTALDFGLAATRAAAGKWAASAAAILGILSTVAVVAGPSELAKDVGGREAKVAAILVVVAGGLAALAILLAGTAEQGSPLSGYLSGGKLRAVTRVRAQRAAKQIRWSRILTVLALVLIVAATGVTWLTALTKKKSSGQSALVVSSAGAKCGTLSVSATGEVTLFVVGKAEALPPGARLTLVDSCA